MKWAHGSQYLVASAALGSSLALVACAQSPPTAEMRGARDSIARAAYDGAPDLAPQPFHAAQDKVARAQSGVNDNDMTQAKYLAEEAQADADYADAASNAAKTTATAMQLQGAQQKLQGKLQ
jgi:hypothetical protein